MSPLPFRSMRGPSWTRPFIAGGMLLLAALGVVAMAVKNWRDGSPIGDAAEYLVVAVALGAGAAVLFWLSSRTTS